MSFKNLVKLKHNMFIKVKVVKSFLFHYIQQLHYACKRHLFKKEPGFELSELIKLLKIEKNQVIWIYCGLKRLNIVTKKGYSNLAKEIIKLIEELYYPKVIIVATNTFTFRKSGVFSVNYSRSEVGAFSEIFRDICNYRSEEPIHNYCIKYNIEDPYEVNETTTTYGENSIYRKSYDDDAYIIDIDTVFRNQYMHYLEYKFQLPYIINKIYSGIVYDKYDIPKHVIINTSTPKKGYKWNRIKILKNMKKLNIIRIVNYKGIIVYAYKVCDLHNFLLKKLNKDPYYFVD